MLHYMSYMLYVTWEYVRLYITQLANDIEKEETSENIVADFLR